MSKPSSIGVIFSEDRKNVLLVKRRDVPVWVLPGGGIEKNETSEKAVLREVFEETGFKVKILRKVGEYSPINKLTRYTHLFECQIISGSPLLNKEAKDIKFFSLKALPKFISPPYEEWIDEAFQNLTFVIQRPLSTITYLRLFKNFLLHPTLVLRFLLSRIGLYINI
jgi:8-oxo-dGTP diphosphatase